MLDTDTLKLMTNFLQRRNVTIALIIAIVVLNTATTALLLWYAKHLPADTYIVKNPMVCELDNADEHRKYFLNECGDSDFCKCSYNFITAMYTAHAIQVQTEEYEKSLLVPQYALDSFVFCKEYLVVDKE